MIRRNGKGSAQELDRDGQPATISFATETFRSQQVVAEPPKAEDRISLFWRIFGGTILSITALVAIQAYQALAANIHELRSDQNRLRETAADFVKKDEFATRSTSIWNRLQDLQSIQANVTVVGAKLASLEAQAAVSEKERKESLAAMAQLSLVRDKLGQIDDVKKFAEQDHKDVLIVSAALQSLRDKDANLEKKLQEAENERKDLIREIQTLRERLAKVEGQNQTPPTTIGKAFGRGDNRN